MRVNIKGVIGEITTLPGCSQVAVSHAVFVPTDKRGKGLGTEANLERLCLMEELGYDYALCTVDANNKAQLKVLEANGWSELASFISSKTGHNVLIYGRQLSCALSG